MNRMQSPAQLFGRQRRKPDFKFRKPVIGTLGFGGLVFFFLYQIIGC